MEAVSYTHLDVYKRQGGNYHKISIAHLRLYGSFQRAGIHHLLQNLLHTRLKDAGVINKYEAI